MANNGDKNRKFDVKTPGGTKKVFGIGSFHKTLPHDPLSGEVDQNAFKVFLKATSKRGPADPGFKTVPKGPQRTGDVDPFFVNPQAGLESDRLIADPSVFSMPPAAKVDSTSTAAEMTEIYWMALGRDVSFHDFSNDPIIKSAASDIDRVFKLAYQDSDNGRMVAGVDAPGGLGKPAAITPHNVFRLGLPGEEMGPIISQFFIRDIGYGTQMISQCQTPYTAQKDYLTKFADWLHAQDTGDGEDGKAYNHANEASSSYYEPNKRFIASMRDLARFVNKDALHQAYFNAALILLNTGANWTPGNPYVKGRPLFDREVGFGTLGGPHILALVSEVATRALKVVWYQKWQENLRLRPEAYGGLVHVQEIGGPGGKRGYGLPLWGQSVVGPLIRKHNVGQAKDDTLLLPMAYTSGSPAHPSYGAGHATVAGACVTVLKAFFETFTGEGDKSQAVLLSTLKEKKTPFDPNPANFQTYVTRADKNGKGAVLPIKDPGLTIEGELNKLAMNVAMGRTMGGVHWRTDNTRSLQLGEALAAHILADITSDLKTEKPAFAFRTFARKMNGKPKVVTIEKGRIKVDGKLVKGNASAL